MNTSLSEILIDLVLDSIELYEKNKKRAQIILSALLLGSSCGFASAAFVPETPDTDLLLASVLYEEAQELAQEEEEAKIEITYTEEELQKVHEEAILAGTSDLCSEQLTGDYVGQCESHFWNIQASLQANASLCDNIALEEEKTKCSAQFSDDNPLFTMNDQEIEAQAEKCLLIEGVANQEVCWNGLFLSVAIHNGDTEKCENIKDEKTLSLCKERSTEKNDENTKAKAIESKNISLCDEIISTSIYNSCKEEVLDQLLMVTGNCNAACIDQKAFRIATEREDVSICKQAATEMGINNCSDATYDLIAKAETNSIYCENILNETKASSCRNSVTREDDKNPEVQADVFKTSDRDFPSIGTSLLDPFQDSLSMYNQNGVQEDVSQKEEFTSVLDTLNGIETQSAASIQTGVCKIYTTVEQRSACEDSLILQAAIPNKDISKCAFIRDESTREYCELEIVQGDAIRAAQEAKEKCYSLSSDSAQQKCLKNTGFLTQTTSAADCLDYADPVDRIACMRENNISTEETTTSTIEETTEEDEFEDFDVIDDLEEIESIIEESLVEID